MSKKVEKRPENVDLIELKKNRQKTCAYQLVCIHLQHERNRYSRKDTGANVPGHAQKWIPGLARRSGDR